MNVTTGQTLYDCDPRPGCDGATATVLATDGQRVLALRVSPHARKPRQVRIALARIHDDPTRKSGYCTVRSAHWPTGGNP